MEEDSSHQQTIYQCLNKEEINRLFESLHDYDPQLRVNAAKFICSLIHNSRGIVQSLMFRENNQLSVSSGIKNSKEGPHKLLITGLTKYPPSRIRDLVLAMNKIKYQKDCLMWYVTIKDIKIGYVTRGDRNATPIDPNNSIIGLFIESEQNHTSSAKQFRNNSSSREINPSNVNQLSSQKKINYNQSFNPTQTKKSGTCVESGRFSIGSRINNANLKHYNFKK